MRECPSFHVHGALSQGCLCVNVCVEAPGWRSGGALVHLIVSGSCPLQPKGTVLVACARRASPGSLQRASL